MRKFHSITALCGDGLRPELQALFDRLAIDPRSELFVRDDGMVQAGPDPASETVLTSIVPLTNVPNSDERVRRRARIWRSAYYSHSHDCAVALLFRTGPVEQVDWANPIAGCSGYSDRISPA